MTGGFNETFCHDFGWDRASFLCRGPHNTVFWIFFCENSGDSTPVLLVFAQRLHRAKDFFASYSTLPLRRLAVHKLGEDTGRTAEVK